MIYPGVKSLLKDLNCVQDASESTRLCLNVLFDAVNRLKCREQEVSGFCRRYAGAVKTSRPCHTPLQHLINFFETDLQHRIPRDPQRAKKIALDCLHKRLGQLDRYKKDVAENGLVHVNDGDTIIMLQSDKVIENLLVQARQELNRRFKAVLVDCCGNGTCQSAKALAAEGIDVVTLSSAGHLRDHLKGSVRLFLGGMAVAADRKIFAPEGTSGIVTLCRSQGVKIHLFASSLWFSPRRSTDHYAAGQNGSAADAALAVVPGDMVCLNAVDHIVTEFGEVGADGRMTVPPVSLARLKAIEKKAKSAGVVETEKKKNPDTVPPKMSAA